MPDRSPLTSAMNTGTPMSEALRDHLQRDGLAGAGGAGDAAMAVDQVGQQFQHQRRRGLGGFGDRQWRGHGRQSRSEWEEAEYILETSGKRSVAERTSSLSALGLSHLNAGRVILRLAM